MKFLATALLVFISFSSHCQKNHPLVKLAPGIMIPKEGDAAFSVFADAGPSFNKFISASVSLGAIFFKGSEMPVLPVGVNLSALNKNSKKVGPYASFGVYYPVYSQEDGGGAYTVKTTGQFFLKAGGGIAFPLSMRQRMIIAAYFSRLSLKSQYSGSSSAMTSASNLLNLSAEITF